MCYSQFDLNEIEICEMSSLPEGHRYQSRAGVCYSAMTAGDLPTTSDVTISSQAEQVIADVC